MSGVRISASSIGSALGLAALGLLSVAPALAQPKPAAKPLSYKTELQAEAKSQALCEAVPNRIFVKSTAGSECISYFVTKGNERKRQAVLFLDGDMALEKYSNPKLIAESYAGNQKGLQAWADKLKVRYVYVSRVGLNGSSGNHGDRRKPNETIVMNTAIDILKERLGLDKIALAGQSGGSTISASLLSMGRTDVSCAVLGSGAFELISLHHASLIAAGSKVTKAKLTKFMYDPSSHVAEIPADPKRRVIIVGDTTDTRTPFDQQVRYANSLRERGHHALLVPIEAAGDLDHGVANYTVPTAGGCLMGTPDAKLLKANDGMAKNLTAKEAQTAPAATTGGAAMVKASYKDGGPPAK